MSQVLYRKWRPQRMDQVVGQDHVTRTLRQAVAQGRVAHAYLFCGPRGTGKTSTARILAKAVNCLSPQDGEPDNTCPMCVAINEGRSLDLIEIDAASNRGIDDIRNLRENVRFTPNEARYKFYIIDEVHMLTEHAFNALLKTLEEPPGHAIFVLATTEPHKVPATIISRCQRFEFHQVSTEAVVAKLANICRSEGVEADEEALRLLARASAGGLRDAENLLERALVTFGSTLTEERVRDMLGLGDDAPALDLARQVLGGRVGEALSLISQVLAQGGDVRRLHRSLMDYLRALLLLKAGAGPVTTYGREVAERLESIAAGTSLEMVVRALQALSQVDFRRDPLSPLPLELAVVSLAVEDAAPGAQETPTSTGAAAVAGGGSSPREGTRLPRTKGTGGADRVANVAESGPPSPRRPQRRQERTPASADPTPGDSVEGDPSGRLERGWPAVVRALSRYKGRRFNIGALLRDCTAREVEDGTVTLRFTHRSHMERMQGELEDPECRRRLKEALARHLGGEYEVRVALMETAQDPSHKRAEQVSPLVRAAQNMGWRIVEEREEPNDEPPNAQAGPAVTAQDDEGPGGA